MSGSFALRKLLFADSEDGDVARRGYHFSGSYEPLMYTGSRLDHPSVIAPKSGFRITSLCLGTCLLGCLLMKRRNKEKWWFGLFFICGMYYNALKAQKVGNGLVGHQAGFFAAGMGAVGSGCRLVLRSGSRRANSTALAVFMSLMWYEIGRYHLWSEHANEFRREVTPERSFELLSEFVPEHIEVEFIPYRELS
ncbi:hypothetical protein STCU_02832 [Strigomonas culicis]|uniref:Uncharacterized protein n=1 Tax=Strigomonas culicis TaxID=28005 RepID=S9VZ36_9TRYP|nr:hypothetical protein STCU_02832 [Strigomonas culicis]|eukprot:EPY32396.1 hypothetical protein STCU_02832 [Strigomonas culicis]